MLNAIFKLNYDLVNTFGNSTQIIKLQERFAVKKKKNENVDIYITELFLDKKQITTFFLIKG